jgi:hypothetical protein
VRRGGLGSALVAYSAARLAENLPEPAVVGWQRVNYRGRDVSLSTGRSTSMGLLVALIANPSAVISVAASAAAGAYDDLRAPDVESLDDKGLRGHLAAARAGRLSGGIVKIAVIGVGAVGAAWFTPGPRSTANVLVKAGLIAGTANLVNLFDLRPGRAAKIAFLTGITGIRSTDPYAAAVSGAVTGAALASLPEDLGERGMLGDLGANALGAAIGLRLAVLPKRLRLLALTTVVGLTLASERVSFSRVIDSVAPLRWLDQLGRT